MPSTFFVLYYFFSTCNFVLWNPVLSQHPLAHIHLFVLSLSNIFWPSCKVLSYYSLFLKEAYCKALYRYKEELSRPFDEATTFLSGIESQLNNLCKGTLTRNLDYRSGIAVPFPLFYTLIIIMSLLNSHGCVCPYC